MHMEFVRVTENYQRAGVYYVRTEAMVKGFQIPLELEFDGHDTPDTNYVLAVDGVLPVGTCRLYIVDEETAKIERVAVIKEYRGKGVGSQMILEAEKWLKEKGIKRVVITSRDEAVGFYEKIGYTVDWSRKESGGVFTIVYTEKKL